jgi:hypothetical protein
MTTLMDTVRIEAWTRSPSRPAAPADARGGIPSESRFLERSFEVMSRGGYARTVVGRLAYFDDEAQTYMVLTRDGVLVRVPLRDVTRFARRSAEGSDRCRRPIEDVEASERDNRFGPLGSRLAVPR